MKNKKTISFRFDEDTNQKIEYLKDFLSHEQEYVESNFKPNQSDVIKEAIKYYYFYKVNKTNNSVLYETIIAAINQYLNSQVRVDNYFKNNLLNEILINQEILKMMIINQGINYDELLDHLQNKITERIMDYE